LDSGAAYSLLARQQALEQLAQGCPAEQAAPYCRDPDRLADSSTIRRWVWRRMESLRFFAWTPTLFAWDWRATRRGREEVAGLCPLHRESRPSFYVNRRKQVFYCHGCGRGGGPTRPIRWLEAAPQPTVGLPAAEQLLERTYGFYQRELLRSEAGRAYPMRLGYSRSALLERGSIDERGRDGFFRCLTFPLAEAGNLYGRSLGNGSGRQRFPTGSKGGLYGWTQALGFPRFIVVEGLFDVAALWQAGFSDAVAERGREIEWANRFPDAQCVRGLQVVPLEAYAYTLLHFLRWWSCRPGVYLRCNARWATPTFTPPCSTCNRRHKMCSPNTPAPSNRWPNWSNRRSHETASPRRLASWTFIVSRIPMLATSFSNSCYAGSSGCAPASKCSYPAQKPRNGLRLAR